MKKQELTRTSDEKRFLLAVSDCNLSSLQELCLSLIADAYSKKIAGCNLQPTPEMEKCVKAPTMALQASCVVEESIVLYTGSVLAGSIGYLKPDKAHTEINGLRRRWKPTGKSRQ